ncbi:hypothetical protein H8356DRAFT_958130 [Neocallimastix lanati (nom. inval.)]|uniref:Uncharacterized protein n=1 Tax=Neocallimastix californiae TaxID=1754190 RepID=A0A1Y2CRK0_9FUNG|nr:hypothetical protein H8356DRAFT_958130 [Neocallimastix sp. JGI-2020a]ORY49669.1 hypothetical protein LY90DRAFT_703004 [Neocallimastix californiae]|eukprot:ORY49669.1 hypothetical protein LY90DRAFT_703004 [Neocallimastix californiae]
MELDSILLYFYLNFVLRINQVFIFYKQNLNKNEIIVKAKPLSCVRQFLQSFLANDLLNLKAMTLFRQFSAIKIVKF